MLLYDSGRAELNMEDERTTFVFVLPDKTQIPGFRHRNPDGTLGGFVATTASVARSAFVHSEAFVEPGKVVGAYERVEADEPCAIDAL